MPGAADVSAAPAASEVQDNAISKDAAVPPDPRARSRSLRLPAWLNHFNLNDLKITFRCWVAVWVATLLLLITPSVQNLGVSAFFAALVLYINPPSGILMIYLFAAVSMLVGMCLAWGWGILTMKAAFAARSASETQALLQQLQQQAVHQANQTGVAPAVAAADLIYNGFMLDARVVVITYVMCCVFIYALARLRYANAKMIFLQLFGTIVINIFLVTGPLLTKVTPTLGEVLVKPGAIGIGLGVACSVLIFPQSTSYVALGQMEQLIRMAEEPLHATQRFLAGDQIMTEAELQAAKLRIIGVFKAVQPALGFLPIDFSRGRWDADDVRNLYRPVREGVSAALFMLDFHIIRLSSARRDMKRADSADSSPSQDSTNGARNVENRDEKIVVGSSEPQSPAKNDLVDALRDPNQSFEHNELIHLLRDTTAEVLDVDAQALRLAAETVHIVNTSRWYLNATRKSRLAELEGELKDIRTRLQAARELSVTNSNEAIIRVHADLFDEQGKLKDPEKTNAVSLRNIIISMIIEERIVGAASATEGILDTILELLQLRTDQRIWVPSRMRYALSWIFNSQMAAPLGGTGSAAVNDPDNVREQAQETHRRLRMVRKGTGAIKKRRSFLTKAIVGTYRWLTNPGGIFALRNVIVTIALSIPASLPQTAGFFYREKGLWALIMGQMCILMYMADFTWSLVSRAFGTILGGVLGLVAWYAGSGNGPGNPYGLGATTAVIGFGLIWWRIYASPAYLTATIMTSATFVLIVGFSWDQDHVAQYGLPGIGYVAFWKRIVTVLVGFAAATIVQMFPKPPSATRYVAKTLSNTVRTLADHYALLISQWSKPQLDVKKNAGGAAAAEEISIGVAENLAGLMQYISLLKMEVSMTPFDHQLLFKTKELCHEINMAVGKLLVLSSTLPRDLQDRLATHSGILDDQVVGNVMSVLSVIESSLRTGDPLPERLPAPLIQSCLISWYTHHQQAELSIDLIKRDDYRRYCVALSAYMTLLSTIDEMVEVLKGQLGEAHVVHQWEDTV